MGTVRNRIGVWHEKEAREFSESHTSYAADWRMVRVLPGDYPAFLTWNLTGYLYPMPEMLWVEMSALIIDGRMYNGLGGVNYSSEAVEPSDHIHHFQAYDYLIKVYVTEGILTLDDGWEWLMLDARESFDHRVKHYSVSRVMSLVES